MDTDNSLPFGGFAKTVESVMPTGEITDTGDARQHDFPWAEGEQGADQRSVHLNWRVPVKGTVRYQVRMDDTI